MAKSTEDEAAVTSEMDQFLGILKSKISVALGASFKSLEQNQVNNSENKNISVITVFGKHDRSQSFLALSGLSSAVSLNPFQIAEYLGDALFENRQLRSEDSDDSRLPNVEATFVADRSTLVLAVGLPIEFFQLGACSSGVKRKAELEIFRYLSILFALSHIVVCVEPTSGLSLRYVTIFKTLWQASQKTTNIRGEVMKKLKIFPNSVGNSGRLCAPRLLFIFDCRRVNLSSNQPGNEGISRKIREMRHSLEDQAYRILRNAHIVHPSNANKGLVSIPGNEEFVAVIVQSETSENVPSVNATLMNIITNGLGSKKSQSEKPSRGGPQLNSFQRAKDFIFRHVEQIHASDSGTRRPQTSVPLSCSLIDWIRVFIAVEKALSNSQAIVRSVDRFLFVNNSFTETLCKQALEAAKAAYAEGLPRYYSMALHEERVEAARLHFYNRARNSVMADRYLRDLESYCESFFSVDRRLCERMSIFGSVCTLPLHRVPGEICETEDEERLPVRMHACSVISKTACNCGRMQADRDDPFTSFEANFEFYQQLEEDCCHELVHQPLEPLKGPHKVVKIDELLSSEIEEIESSDNDELTLDPLSLSPNKSHDDEPVCFWSLLSLGSFGVYHMTRGLVEYPGFVNGAHYLYPIGIGTNGEPVVVARPGPGMTSSNRNQANSARGPMSPAVVAYFGVEFECPKGHRFLLETPEKAQRIPLNQVGGSPSMANRVSGGRAPPQTDLSIQPPLCLSDIPLFFACCQCPTKAPSSGQLMRIYVLVPPESPASVNVSLSVRIQASSNFVFSPRQPDGSEEIKEDIIPLPHDNLWVLRLPLVYVNRNAPVLEDQEMPILPVDHADYANFKLHANFLRFEYPGSS